jgi:RHS repeat-associated protein
VLCQALDGCHLAGVCDPATGQCANPAKADGAPCDDGDTCTRADTCTAGACRGEQIAGCIRIPPDPATVAPAIDPTVSTDFAASNAFLYTGPNPIQTGVAAGTIQPRRIAIVRGRALARDGTPLPGVTVSMVGHPELGATATRADGQFDFALNGGGSAMLSFSKDGYLPAQRQIPTRWRGFAHADDVVLIALDAEVTAVALGAASPQVAGGSVVTDAAGSRKAMVLVPSGTQAGMLLPGGVSRPLTTMHVRATEYTVGPSGFAAMPASLPPESAYTYAVELSVDEAIAAGATSVQFDKALPFYLDNFLHFPAGTTVPAGFYDRGRGAWVPSDGGVVLTVLSVSGGMADLDITGSGAPSPPGVLASRGITDAERVQIATLYGPGKSLWRVPLQHFSALDCNFAFRPPPGATPPPQDPPKNPGTGPNPCDKKPGSIISCQSQILGEAIPIAGTPYSLRYASDRAPGSIWQDKVVIPLSGATVPAALKRIDLEIDVAGRHLSFSHPPLPNQSHTFVWDGLDAYGRLLQGQQKADILVSYAYDGVYAPTARFGDYGDGTIVSGDAARQEVSLAVRWSVMIGHHGPAGAVAGWTVDVHHAFDPATATLSTGDGQTRIVGGPVINRAAGRRNEGCAAGDPCGDGGLAVDAHLSFPLSIAHGPDGSLYVADKGSPSRIRRIDPGGIITTVAGANAPCDPGASNLIPCGNGGPAVQAGLGNVFGLAVGPDGSLFISEYSWVRRIGPDGIIRVVAGKGSIGSDGDGGLATLAHVSLYGLAAGPDGSVYLAESDRIRRVGPNGIIATIAGTGALCQDSQPCGDGGPARQAAVNPSVLALARDGTIYFDQGDHFIRRITPDGTISRFAGKTPIDSDPHGDGGPATAAIFAGIKAISVGLGGSIFISDAGRVRRVGTDGIINTVAGPGNLFTRTYVEGGPATRAFLGGRDAITGVSEGPDGFLYLADNQDRVIQRVALPSSQEAFVPAEDGSEYYRFQQGRHQRTVDALTNAVVRQFSYDANGLPTQISDGSGNTTTLRRDAKGDPSSIEGPFGQVTSLSVDGSGNLGTVAGPGGETWRFAYGAGGLLTALTDPAGGLHRFTYDAEGRLIKDEGPAGSATSLARTETPRGYRVEASTAGGTTTTYEVENLPTGGLRRFRIEPGMGRTEILLRTDGSTRYAYPDGTIAELVEGPDPRFGMQVPVINSLIVTSPGGSVSTTTASRTAVLAGPVTLASQTDTVTIDGSSYQSVFDAASRTLTVTSAAGRQLSTTLDSLGRVASQQGPAGSGRASVTQEYGPRGLLAKISQGAQSSTFGYDAHGRLAKRTDALGKVTSYERDSSGRLSRFTTPGGRSTGFSFNAAGNVTQLSMPGLGLYSFEYNPADSLSSYRPPGNPGLQITYDLDQRPGKATLPGGRTEQHGLDAAGRVVSLTYAEATTAIDYLAGDTTSREERITRTPATGPAQALAFGYDGARPTAMRWSGAATGDYSYLYDASSLLSASAFTSGTDIVSMALMRDQDGLVTGLGPFTLARSGPAGLTSQISDGVLSLAFGYDPLSRLSSCAQSVAGQQRFQAVSIFDTVGRLVESVETTAAGTSTVDYSYDDDSRLTQVLRNGVPAEHYSYDDNGNRTRRQLGINAPELAVYDAQDRLTAQGGLSYQFDTDGYLTQRGSDLFHYSAAGELVDATIVGSLITYSYDGLRRRTGRTDAAGTTQYLYGNPEDDLQLTHSRSASGALTTYYYDDARRLFALRRGPDLYYVATDRTGSPRLVSTAAGLAVKRIDYDGFGQVLQDSNPAWELPVGFAGGLADPATRLVRFGLRDYDPGTGRWTARDPALLGGRQINPYVYVSNNPVNLVDPAGLFSLGLGLCEGVCVGTKLSITSKGISACVEAGFGIGDSIELEPFDGLDDSGLTFEGKLAVKLGVVKVEGGVTGLGLGDCAYKDAKAALEVCAGGACYRPLTPKNEKLETGVPKPGPPKVKGKGLGIEGKYVGKVCQKAEW